MDTNVKYCVSRYFVGMKVEVGIPLPNTETFRDWAIVNEIDDDLISLQLSRDILPEGVNLRLGQSLTIRSEADSEVHSCRCIVVSMGYDNELLLRLTSEIFSGQTREFHRVDAFLPIKYQRPEDQSFEAVKKLWEARRRLRLEEKRVGVLRCLETRRERALLEEQSNRLKVMNPPQPAEPVPQQSVESEVLDKLYNERNESAEPMAVTISAGGLKILTRNEFSLDNLILLEILIPSSRLVIDVIARVVYTSPADDLHFHTGMQFVLIDEAGRFAINSHLTSLQLRRIRHFKGFNDVEALHNDDMQDSEKHYAHIDGIDASSHPQPFLWNSKVVFRQLGLGLLFLSMIGLAGFYFAGYKDSHPKNEIEKTFENGINQGRIVTAPAERDGSGGIR